MHAPIATSVWSEQLIQSDQSSTDSPHILILHRFWKPGSDCLPGEEVAAVWFVYAHRAVQVRLPLSLRLLIDFLAKNRWVSQSASQIEAAIRRDQFIARHGGNACLSRKQTRSFSRSSIKIYIGRLREALDIAFQEVGADLKASEVIMRERTVGNEVGYRLKAKVKVVHVP